MKYLIDTNIIIDYLRGDQLANKLIVDFYDGKINGIISVITECELLSSIRISDQEKDKIDRLLNIFPKVLITSKVARKAGNFRSAYPMLEIGDALIAANCFYAKAILLTRNLKHFAQIKEIQVDTI